MPRKQRTKRKAQAVSEDESELVIDDIDSPGTRQQKKQDRPRKTRKKTRKKRARRRRKRTPPPSSSSSSEDESESSSSESGSEDESGSEHESGSEDESGSERENDTGDDADSLSDESVGSDVQSEAIYRPKQAPGSIDLESVLQPYQLLDDNGVGDTRFTERFDQDTAAAAYIYWDRLRPHNTDSNSWQESKKDLYRFLQSSVIGAKHTRYHQNNGTGRWYQNSVSMQQMRGCLRGLLASGRYTDIDIVNSGFVLALYILDACGMPVTPTEEGKTNYNKFPLMQYVGNRDKYISQLCKANKKHSLSEKDAKKAYITALNGGVPEVDNPTAHLTKLREHVKDNIKELTTQQGVRQRFRAFCEHYEPKPGKKDNKYGAFFANLSFELENCILETVWDHFGRPTNSALCFDGLLVPKSFEKATQEENYKMLKQCSVRVFEMTGVPVVFKIKPFDVSLKKKLSQIKVDGLFDRLFRPKPVCYRTLRQLTQACCHDVIIKNMTKSERKSMTKSEPKKTGKGKRKKSKREPTIDGKKQAAFVKRKYMQAEDELVQYLNRYMFTVNGSTTLHYHIMYDDNGATTDQYMYKTQKALVSSSWSKYNVTNKTIFRRPMCVAEIWLNSSIRRAFDHTIFAPNTYFPYGLYASNTYNMWQGWRYKENKRFVVEMALIQRILDHLLTVICDDNKELYNYTLLYFKLVLLGYKLGVSLVITGPQGTGKSLMFEYFGRRIIGSDYFFLFQTLEQATSRFSSCRCYKSFIALDEVATWAGDHKTAQSLKSLITQTLTSLEYKCIDAKQVDDFANYAFLSNNPACVKVEYKSDRRYCMYAVNKKKKSAQYFRDLAADMGLNTQKTSDGGVRLDESEVFSKKQLDRADVIGQHFYHYIMSLDISEFKPGDFPHTELRERLEMASTPSLIVFTRWFLGKYKEAHTTKPEPTAMKKVYMADVFSMYKMLMKEFGYPSAFSASSSMSRQLKKVDTFAPNTHRDENGAFFQAKNMTDIKLVLDTLDGHYLIDKDLLKHGEFAVNKKGNIVLLEKPCDTEDKTESKTVDDVINAEEE